MTDPFAPAAARIIKRMGEACTLTRNSDASVVATIAVLDRDVEIVDELGNIVDRDDMISLLSADVGVAKSRDFVTFTTSGEVFTLGRTIKDDGFVMKMLAHKNG